MGTKNKINLDRLYFLTMTVVDWVDVFSRPVYKHVLIDSLKYCQNSKGLEIYAWVIMTNHIHLIAAAKPDIYLGDIIRDFKKYTNKKIIQTIVAENESRRKWMLDRFEFSGRFDKRIKNYRFWQEGNEAKEIYSNEFLEQKLNYIHQNPVRAEYVAEPEHYIYSSAIDYAGGKGLLDVILV